MKLNDQNFSEVLDKLPPYNGKVEFNNCTFSGAAIGKKVRHPQDRLVVKNITARNCTADSVVIGPLLFENLHVENLRTTDRLWLPGCAFKECVFRGRIGEVVQFPEVDPVEPLDEATNARFWTHNEQVWAEAEYALDISEAEFDDVDFQGIPGEAIRISSRNQICVDFQRARSARDSGAIDQLAEYPRLVMKNALSIREATEYNFVLATHSSSESYREMNDLFNWLAEHCLLYEC